MKKFLLVLPLVALIFTIGCFRQPQPDQERQEFREQLESQIEKFERSIEQARERARGLPHDTRAKLEEQIDELEREKITLANKLEEMKAASDDDWRSFKTDLEAASNNLESAVNNLQAALEEALSQV